MELLGMKILDYKEGAGLIKYFAQCFLFNLPESLHRMYYENPKMNANIGNPENDRNAKANGFIMKGDDSELEKERWGLIWGEAYRAYQNELKSELGAVTDSDKKMHVLDNVDTITCVVTGKEIPFTKEGMNAHIVAEWKASKKKKGKAIAALVEYLAGTKKATPKTQKTQPKGLSALDQQLANHKALMAKKIARQTARVHRNKKGKAKRI